MSAASDVGDELGRSPISTATHRPAARATSVAPAARTCLSCRGAVGLDGYCEVCGTRAPSERDHFEETPASWVAGVCDRGIVHSPNEDAMALLASATPGQRAVLLVLDGVSNSVGSDVASLAGARAAREVLRTPLPQGMGTPQSRSAAISKVFADAVRAANDAVIAVTDPASTNPASATFTCAVLEDRLVAHANLGDSRVYWLPDGGPAVQLTVDDSAAQAQMEAGVPREVAETSPMAHAITKWLGRDSPDITPRVGQLELTGPGWLLACSDGLWNYASEPPALAAALAACGSTEPRLVAQGLTDFANDQGGRDNITVAVARVEVAVAVQNAPEAPTGIKTDTKTDTETDTDQQQRESDG